MVNNELGVVQENVANGKQDQEDRGNAKSVSSASSDLIDGHGRVNQQKRTMGT